MPSMQNFEYYYINLESVDQAILDNLDTNPPFPWVFHG